jgi:hypothetical protein
MTHSNFLPWSCRERDSLEHLGKTLTVPQTHVSELDYALWRMERDKKTQQLDREQGRRREGKGGNERDGHEGSGSSSSVVGASGSR